MVFCGFYIFPGGVLRLPEEVTEDLVSTSFHMLGGGVLDQEHIVRGYIKVVMRILVLSLNLYLGGVYIY